MGESCSRAWTANALHKCVQQCMRSCTRTHKRTLLNLPCKNTLVGCGSWWRGGEPRVADRSWHGVNCYNDGTEVWVRGGQLERGAHTTPGSCCSRASGQG